MVSALNSQGHDHAFQQVPAEMFATFFPGAEEVAQMLAWQAYPYLGKDADSKIALAKQVTTEEITSFASWALTNLPAEETG